MWQAWHNLTSTVVLRGRRGTDGTHNLTSTVVLRGRRGTDGTGWRAWTGLGAAVTPVTPRHFCVAGVALGDIHLDFTPGRRGTTLHLPSFCVAGVGQMALGGALGLV